ncbi:hypothetical protein CTheo_6720 [Ceratobasidium theobromae]|uniref:Transmembrane protein n=1 Tax=Ceratobasidium theobromae TaxID=1582974 RepID=A0A5N5QEF8_9AGAM|nr:hypothetical protein CTheo_6720 [Ceratobasidium theobromae]
MDIRLAIFVLLLGHIFQLSTAQGFSKKIRIDDSYIYSPTTLNGLQYAGSWAHYSSSDVNGRYLNTLSSTTDDPAFFNFFFRGNSISYYADTSLDQNPPYVWMDNNDAVRITNASLPFATQQQLWTISGLDEGDHHLMISMSHKDANKSSFSLDFLEITYITDNILPSRVGPAATDAPGVVVGGKDDRIKYQGNWIPSPFVALNSYPGLPVWVTNTPGSSVTFSFNGTAVHYFCNRGGTYGWASISVDGGQAESVSLTFPSTNHYLQVLTWSKTNLTAGPHMVRITHPGTSDKFLSLSFFKYTPCTTPSCTDNSIPDPEPSCTNNSGVSCGNNPPPKSSNKLPLTVIIGGSVGGTILLTLLILLAFALFFFRHRRSQPRPQENLDQKGSLAEPIPIHPDGLNAANLPYNGHTSGPILPVSYDKDSELRNNK